MTSLTPPVNDDGLVRVCAVPCRVSSKLQSGIWPRNTLPIGDCSAPDGSRRGLWDEWPRPPVRPFRPQRAGFTTVLWELAISSKKRGWETRGVQCVYGLSLQPDFDHGTAWGHRTIHSRERMELSRFSHVCKAFAEVAERHGRGKSPNWKSPIDMLNICQNCTE